MFGEILVAIILVGVYIAHVAQPSNRRGESDATGDGGRERKKVPNPPAVTQPKQQESEEPEESDPTERELTAVTAQRLSRMGKAKFIHPLTSTGNILLLGTAGAGKSTFLNTLDSLFLGRISRLVDRGTGTEQCTTKLRRLRFSAKKSYMQEKFGIEDFPEELNMRFYDSMGWNDHAYQQGEFAYILDGNVPPNFEFNRQGTITPDAPGFIKNPKITDMPHVVVFVLSANQACTDQNLNRVREVLRLARQRNLRALMLLTQIDKLDSELVDKPHLADNSTKIQEVIEAVQSCGLDPQDIFPMKSYHQENRPNPQVEYLLSGFLECLAYCCEDFFRCRQQEAQSLCPSDE